MGQTLASIILFVLAGGIFYAARQAALQGAGIRRKLIAGSLFFIALALVGIFWLPRKVPETPGSPGTLVAIALLWVFGAAVILVALPTLLGAFFTRPRVKQEEE